MSRKWFKGFILFVVCLSVVTPAWSKGSGKGKSRTKVTPPPVVAEAQEKKEEMVRIILKCLSEETSLGAGAKEVGGVPATLRRWIGTYETEGEEGFLYKHNAAYNAQTKTAAVIDYRKGLGSLLNICKKYRIRDTRTLRNWIKV